VGRVNKMNHLSKKQKLSFGLLAGLLCLVTLFAIYWVVSSSQVSLGNMSNAELDKAIERLSENGIKYRVDQSGQLFVDSADVTKSQVHIAHLEQQVKPGMGMELFDNLDYSMTESAQTITFMRALQGELEQTLSALEYIEAARVHLSLKEKKLFDNEATSKAAVTVFTQNGRALTPSQIDGVQSLVASSVDELTKQNVAIFNNSGQKISYHNENQPAFTPVQQNSRESELKTKVEQLLSLYFSKQNFVVAVTLNYEATATDSVINSLITHDDQKGFVAQEKRSSKLMNKDELTSESKQPTSETTEIKYVHGTRVDDIKTVERQISSLSVAVAIRSDDAQAQQGQLERLISTAVGLEPKRGDALSVNIMPKLETAKKSTPAVAPKIPKVEPSSNHGLTKQLLIGTIFIFLIITILLGFAVRKYRLTHQQRESLLLELNDLMNIRASEHSNLKENQA